MVTGLDLSKLFDDKIDNSYSDYVSVAKKQRAFDNAFLRVIENKYRGMDTQKEFDELSELMVIDRPVYLNANRFRTTPVPVSSVAIGTPTEFTFGAEHNLAEGDTFVVSGVSGTSTGINQTHTVPVGGVTSPTVITLQTPSTGTATPNTGSATTSKPTGDSLVEDYLHVLAIKCYMYDPNETIPVYKFYAGTPGVIEFFRPIRSRSMDYIHGSTFTSPTNFAIVKQISEFKYELYSPTIPASFSSPITITQGQLTGSSVSVVEVNWAKYLQSDRRISKSGEPSIDEPRFNQHKNFILIHPKSAVCPLVSVDYIRKPSVEIRVDDNVQDLTLYYSETLLNRLTDEAVKMFYQEVRDPNQYQVADREMIDNP